MCSALRPEIKLPRAESSSCKSLLKEERFQVSSEPEDFPQTPNTTLLSSLLPSAGLHSLGAQTLGPHGLHPCLRGQLWLRLGLGMLQEFTHALWSAAG